MPARTPEHQDGEADLLWGVAAIASAINRPERQTSYMIERGLIPAGKSGRLWVGSRQKLREHFEALTAGRGA